MVMFGGLVVTSGSYPKFSPTFYCLNYNKSKKIVKSHIHIRTFAEVDFDGTFMLFYLLGPSSTPKVSRLSLW